MNGPAWVVVVTVALSGCLGGGGPAANVGGATESAVKGPETVEDYLMRIPHFVVNGPTAIELEVTKVDTTGFGFSANLLHIGVPVKPGVHKFFKNPLLIAFIPFNFTEQPTCGPMPSNMHFRYGPATPEGAPGANLTGEYKPGWYHAVILSRGSANYRVVFNSTRDQTVDFDPGPDPWVEAGVQSWNTKKTYEESVPVKNTWFGFSTFQAGGGWADAGRELTLSLNAPQECSSARLQQGTNEVPNHPLLGTKRVSTWTMGQSTSVTAKASYKPTAEASAPAAADLQLEWVSIRPPELPPTAVRPPSTS